jgi:hypothetical protein
MRIHLVVMGCCCQLVVAAASRRRTSAAGRRSYEAVALSQWTFYERIFQLEKLLKGSGWKPNLQIAACSMRLSIYEFVMI